MSGRNNKAREGCVWLRINRRVNWRGSRLYHVPEWSHDQNENEAEIHQTGSQEAASHDQGNSFSLADDMLNHSFEMMHTSSEFFSQYLSRAKGVCPYTPGLYSSPRLLEGKSRSWCSKHLSGTPDLFSSPGCSPSRQEMNSVSLFSCSNHSVLSS